MEVACECHGEGEEEFPLCELRPWIEPLLPTRYRTIELLLFLDL